MSLVKSYSLPLASYKIRMRNSDGSVENDNLGGTVVVVLAVTVRFDTKRYHNLM